MGFVRYCKEAFRTTTEFERSSPTGGKVMRSRIEPMNKVAITLRRHRDLVLNYCCINGLRH